MALRKDLATTLATRCTDLATHLSAALRYRELGIGTLFSPLSFFFL
jgi:hypothetical protein